MMIIVHKFHCCYFNGVLYKAHSFKMEKVCITCFFALTAPIALIDGTFQLEHE